MKMGFHKDKLNQSWQGSDLVLLYQAGQNWLVKSDDKVTTYDNIDNIVSDVVDLCTDNDHIVLMSNGGFGGIKQKLQLALDSKFSNLV
jgi:UDP-N-acetylmuramate: L-alanyl-gamma-D-glutamyl-meso-diaminopimelate ligase